MKNIIICVERFYKNALNDINMKLDFIYRNLILGFLIGKYDIKSQSKKILNKDEQYISGIEIIKFNESIYISTIFLFFLIIYLGTISYYFLLLFTLIPILFLFAFTLEILILSDDRLIVLERSIIQRLLKIENETSIALDKIIILSYSRAPLNKYATAVSSIGFLLTIFYFPSDFFLIFDIFQLILIVGILLSPLFYLTWIGLRLSKRSLELAIFGISRPIGVGREKGIPSWFAYDLQLLVFGYIQYSSPLKGKGELIKQEELQESNVTLKELLDQTPFEIHKKILVSIRNKPLKTNEIVNTLSDYSRKEINEGIDSLRKKRMIYFIRRTKEWSLNLYPKVGINKK